MSSMPINAIRKKDFYVTKDKDDNINRVIFPHTIKVGLENNSVLNATISGSIHHTHEGKSYLVGGEGINITSGSNGQVTISSDITTIEGPPGSAITIILDPMSVLLISNNDGTVSDYTPSGATIKVYENGTQLNINTTASLNSTWFVVSATGTNITEGTILAQNNGDTLATIDNASNITANTATISYIIRVKNSLGSTTDYTVTQTIAKAITGNDGASGSTNISIYSIDSSSSSVNISDPTSTTNNYATPWDVSILTNTSVISSVSSGEFTIANTGTYMITVQISATQNGDATNTYGLSFAQDDGAGSYTDVTVWSDEIIPGGNGKSAEFLISGAILTYSNSGGGGTYKLKTQIKKDAANTTYAYVKSSNSYLATIRIEKLN